MAQEVEIILKRDSKLTDAILTLAEAGEISWNYGGQKDLTCQISHTLETGQKITLSYWNICKDVDVSLLIEKEIVIKIYKKFLWFAVPGFLKSSELTRIIKARRDPFHQDVRVQALSSLNKLVQEMSSRR